MFDVLVYLYENYGALHACPDSDSLSKRLTDAGFDDEEISDALTWLSGLQLVTSESIAIGPESERAFRVYAATEFERLGFEAVGFLSFLEQASQLTPTQREIVIERALATDETPISIDKLKVIVLMVLWSQQADIDVLLLEELLGAGDDKNLTGSVGALPPTSPDAPVIRERPAALARSTTATKPLALPVCVPFLFNCYPEKRNKLRSRSFWVPFIDVENTDHCREAFRGRGHRALAG